MLTINNLKDLAEERKSSFSVDFWINSIADREHFELVSKTKHPVNYRLLYDSWLWRHIFSHIRPAGFVPGTEVMELLPGASLTIPVALQSVGFQGRLTRVNNERPVALPSTLSYAHCWHEGPVESLLKTCLCQDLIVGNHVIDDLLFNMYFPDAKHRATVYSDAQLCKLAWAEIATSNVIRGLQNQLVCTFLGLLDQAPRDTVLALRHYPSTFAVTSRDLSRINLEMQTFSLIARMAQKSGKLKVYFFDDSVLKVPRGSKHHNSVLVISK